MGGFMAYHLEDLFQSINDIYYQEIAIEKGAKITGKLIRL